MGLEADAVEKISSALAQEISAVKISAAKEKALSDFKAKNFTAVSALLDMNRVSVSEDGSVTGISEQLKALKADESTHFLFESEAAVKGALPGEKGEGDAKINLDSMSYEQLCEHFSE